ncbi:MAG: LptF/LptG family permease, partial [Chitinophagales bacterium]
MKKLDLFIIKKFLGTFFFSILLFTLVAIIIDLTEKIDNFFDKYIPLDEIVFDYYLNFIPYIDALLAPLFIFISVIFFTSKMASNSEIVAILGSGVSFYRLLAPYIFSATLLATLLFFTNHFIVPEANKGRLSFEYTHISSHKLKHVGHNIHMQIQKDTYIYIENYTPKDSVGYKFTYEKIKNGKLIYKLRADKIQWSTEKQQWEMRNYFARKIDQMDEEIRQGRDLDTLIGFYPKDFDARTSLMEEMNSIELNEHIAELKQKGSDNTEFYQIEFYRRTADAFTAIILTLIGFSLASRKMRGGLGLHIVLGFALSSGYILFSRFSTTFSTNGNLDPFWGVWIPNIIFGILAL